MGDIEQTACVAPIVGRAAFAKELICFLSRVWQLKSVKRVGYTYDAERLDLWVVLREDGGPQDMERISLMDQRFRQAVGGAPMDLHVSSLAHVKEENLAPTSVIFER